MSPARLFVCIPIHGRLPIAEACVPTVRAGMKNGHDTLALHGDGTELTDSLIECADVCYQGPNIGIERQRRRHFLDFDARVDRMEWTHLYLTDADAPHDPQWRSELLRIQDKYDGLPICGFNTAAHVRLANNLVEDEPESEIIIRRLAPGISYLLTREHVEKVVAAIAQISDGHWNWDWSVPLILGSRFAITHTSLVDHIGAGGMHHDGSAGYEGGDRCLAPTAALVEIRKQIVAQLSK